MRITSIEFVVMAGTLHQKSVVQSSYAKKREAGVQIVEGRLKGCKYMQIVLGRVCTESIAYAKRRGRCAKEGIVVDNGDGNKRVSTQRAS